MPDWLSSDTAGIFLVALLLGGMAFYSFVMTPLVFAKMERGAAADFLRESFAAYYRVMGVLSVVAAIALWRHAEGVVMAAVAVGFVFLITILLPAINRARDARDAGDAAMTRRFGLWHRFSVIINFAQIVAAAAVMIRLSG